MAREQREIRIEAADGLGQTEPSIGDLVRQLTADSTALFRQEIRLAKVEVRETASAMTRDLIKIGVALGLALVGVLALTAFLIVALGDLMDNYWLSALIVAVVYLAIGGILAKNAMNDMKKRQVKPEETIRTLQEDKAWAQREVRDLKREVTA